MKTMFIHSVFFIVVALLSFFHCTTADILSISDTRDFISFTNDLSAGRNFSGTTVLLESDIEFASAEMVGSTGWFEGVLDGQGYTVFGLKMRSPGSSSDFGLVGRGRGMALRNIVVEASGALSATLPYSGDIYTIGFVGRCHAAEGRPCVVENVVNMANLFLSGESLADAAATAYMGGIIGTCAGTGAGCTVKNCANYGSLYAKHSGPGVTAWMGGIVGRCDGCEIYNSVSYGKISVAADMSHAVYIGGVCGVAGGDSRIENCLSGNTISRRTNVGGVVNSVEGSRVTVTHCYWTEEYDAICEHAAEENTVPSMSNSRKAILDSPIMEELNEYAEENGWDRWIMLDLGEMRISGIEQSKLIVTQGHFPEPVGNKVYFLYWSTDREFSGHFNPRSTPSTNLTTLYPVVSNRVYASPSPHENESKSSSSSSPKAFSSSSSSNLHSSTQSSMTSSSSVTASEYVEVVFYKNIAKKEIEDAVKKYSDAKFEIVEIKEVDGDMKVIVKFEEAKSAGQFERKVTESISRGQETTIKRVATYIDQDFSENLKISLCGLIMLLAFFI